MTTHISGKSTIKDLAAFLGLDKSTISLALRGSSRVSQRTRERVMRSAREHGYLPNMAARMLASRSPQVIGLVLPDDLRSLHHEVVVTSIQHLTRAAGAAGVAFVVVAMEEILESVKDNRSFLQPDGLLIWGDVPAHITATVNTVNRPIVVLDPNDISYVSYTGPSVQIDNAGGARQIVDHLLEQGVKRLLFVQSNRSHLGHQQRWHGTREGWLAHRNLGGLSFCYQDELTESLLRQFSIQENAAIFCSNDMCAMEIWHMLRGLDIAAPEQVLLASFDGDRVGSLIGLTSAVFDCQSLAQQGLGLLMSLLRKEDISDKIARVSVQVRIGRTTRRIQQETIS